MTWTGFAWLLNAFVAADSPAIFTLAVLASNLYLAAFVHLLLAYPEGRVRRRGTGGSVAATYALARDRPAADPDVRARRAVRRRARSPSIQVTSAARRSATIGDVVHERRGRRARRRADLGADRALARRDAARSAARSRRCCGRGSC